MTTLFPEELIQQCLLCEDHEDPGALLQLVLSVLEENTVQDEELDSFQSQLAQNLSSAQLESDNNNNNNNNLPKMLYSILTTNPTTTTIHQSTNPSTLDTWYLGLQLMARLLQQQQQMTPFEVHSVAMQSVAFGSHATVLYWTLMVLLCVWSLQQCHAQILTLTALEQQPSRQPVKKIRYKRIRSLLLETIQVYQRQVLKGVEEEEEEETSATHHPHSPIVIPLWIDWILPVGQSLWKLFPNHVQSQKSLFWEAILTSMASHLVIRSSESVLLEELYPSVLNVPLEALLCHPWRVASSQPTRPSNQQQESLDWWTLERSQEISKEDDDDSSIPPDEFEAIDTSWDELGIAILASQAWQDRPLVYQAWHQWKLWFPHVANCMNPDLPGIHNPALWTTRGISLLKNLLPILPARSLSLNGSFSVNHDSSIITTSTTRRLSPDNPVGTFQLLLNGIVASAQASAPTMALAQLCKDLLSKYTPNCQLQLILDHLLPSCPHPGLKPKLLDMLRPLVVHLRRATDDCFMGQRLQRDMLKVVSELGGYLNNESDQKLQKADELIDQVEYFVSALGLVHLMGPAASNNPGSIQLEGDVTLADFGKVLSRQLIHWGDITSEQVPDQFFRLNLLDMSIQQLLNLRL